MGRRSEWQGLEKMTEDLEGRITTTIQLKRDLREYKPEIIVGTALGIAAAVWRYGSENPHYFSEMIPVLGAVAVASKAVRHVLATEKDDKDRIQKSLRELKGEIVTNVTGLAIFYGSYLF